MPNPALRLTFSPFTPGLPGFDPRRFDPSGPPAPDPFGPIGPQVDPSGCTLFQVDLPLGQTGTICGPSCECSNGGISVPGIGAVCLGRCVPRGGMPGDPLIPPQDPMLPGENQCPAGFHLEYDPDVGQVVCREDQPGGPQAPPTCPTNGAGRGLRCNERFVMSSGRCPRRIRQRWNQSKGKWEQVRTMNVLNRKAQSRAITRLKGAHRHAKRVIDTLDSFKKPRRSSRRSCK